MIRFQYKIFYALKSDRSPIWKALKSDPRLKSVIEIRSLNQPFYQKNVCQCKNHFSVLTSKSLFVTFSLLVGTVDPFKIDQDDEKERKCDTDGTDGQETNATYHFIEYQFHRLLVSSTFGYVDFWFCRINALHLILKFFIIHQLCIIMNLSFH